MENLANTIKIKIDFKSDNALSLEEIKYIFETLCLTIGIPWHFVNTEYTDEVDIYYGININYRARLWIKSNNKNEVLNAKYPKIISKEQLTFLNFSDSLNNDNYQITNNGNCVIMNDIIYSVFYLLTGKDEKNIGRNKWDQHDILQSFLYKNNLLHTPIFNEYVGLLEKLFSDFYEFVPKWKNGKKAALALSHDIDYPEMIKSIEIIRYILAYKFKFKIKTILDIITGKEHFWKFDDYIKLEKSYNVKSAFYFSSFKGSLIRFFFIAPDPFYDIRKLKFKKVAKELEKEGFEVGLHSSYFAYRTLNDFQKEKVKLQNEFGLEILGNRHHYWHMNPETPSETASIHQKSGLFYDSSISFEKHSGFRYSICTPFHLWSNSDSQALSIIQLPPTLMDDHLFGHSSITSFSTYKEHIDSLINSVASNEGVFVADFHARVLNSTFFPNWGEAYKYLLKTISERDDFYIDTPLNICKFWSEREMFIRNKSKDEVHSTH